MASPSTASAAPLGVAVEGQTTGNESDDAGILVVHQDRRFIDIFTKGSAGFAWTATASAPWIKLSAIVGHDHRRSAGLGQHRLGAVPSGYSMGTVTVSAGGASKTINISVSNPATPSRSGLTGYVEATATLPSRPSTSPPRWTGAGRRGRCSRSLVAERATPSKLCRTCRPSATTNLASASPELDYNVYFFTTGSFPVTVYRMPTLNTTGACRLAIGLDGATPQTLSGANSDGNSAWSGNVTAQVEKLTATIQVTSAGMHTLKLFEVDPSVVVDRIVVDTGGLRPSYLGPPESYWH